MTKRSSLSGLTPVDTATPTKKIEASKNTADRVRAIASKLPPAQPGVRGNDGSAPSDYSVTSRIERLPSETTPAPLPPSPAAEQADVWFDQVPTNPAAAPDLEALAASRPDLTAALRDSSPRMGGGQGRDPWAPPSYTTGPIHRKVPLHRQPWVLPVLLTATALAVGMVLGALLFGGGGSKKQKPMPAVAPADCECPPAADAPTPAKPAHKKKH